MNYGQIARELPWAEGAMLIECDLNGLLAVEKASGLLSHPNKRSNAARSILHAPYSLEMEAYKLQEKGLSVSLLNRLDAATSGIVLLSLNPSVRDSVLEAFKTRKVSKQYQALVFGAPAKSRDIWRDRLAKKHDGAVKRARLGEGAMSETKLLDAKTFPGSPLVSLLTLAPLTGRMHQLRAQATARRLPIVGDKTYGDFKKNKLIISKLGIKRLCLHCQQTSLDYKLRGKSYRFEAKSETPFLKLLKGMTRK